MEVKIKKVLSGFLREWSQARGMLSELKAVPSICFLGLHGLSFISFSLCLGMHVSLTLLLHYFNFKHTTESHD